MLSRKLSAGEQRLGMRHHRERLHCMQVNQRERISNEMPQEKERRLHCMQVNQRE